MEIQIIPLIIVIGYMVAMMVVGAIVSKSQIKNAKDYMVAGRRMGLFMVAFSLSANNIGGGCTTGLAQKAFGDWGMSACWYVLTASIAMIPLAYFAPKIRKTMAVTIPEVVGRRFGKFSANFTGILGAISLFCLTSSQIAASGGVINALIPSIPLNVCLIFAGIVIILYTTMGGMIADQISDLVQFAIIIVGLAIATRPDCLEPEKIELLSSLNRIKPLWIELGLQTIHPATAAYIRRGYDLPVYDDAMAQLKAAGLETVVHMILGLPGESREDMYRTAEYIAGSGADGIKLQLLHILRGTDLYREYLTGSVPTLDMETYIDILMGCIRRLPPQMVIHRMTGDGAKRDLAAPLWSGDKKRVLNAINAAFRENDLTQGSEAGTLSFAKAFPPGEGGTAQP